MATTEERMKILQMIQEGKISAEDGAKLLAALGSSARPTAPPGFGPGRPRRPGVPTPPVPGAPRWLRVRVTDMKTGKTKVNVNLPLRLVDAGLNIAGHFVEDIDFEDVSASIRAALDENMIGKIIDVVEGEDGEHVEIFIE